MIRELHESELGACADILTDTDMWRYYGRSREDAHTLMQREWEQGTIFWAEIEDGEVRGFIGAIPHGMMGEFPYVRVLSVKNGFRGQGVGTRLLGHLEREMFRASRLIFMMVTDFNTGAKRLYNRLGWRDVGEIADYKKDGVNEFLLIKYRGG